MKKFIYTIATIILLISSSFLTSCTVEDLLEDSKNDTVLEVNQIDPPIVPPRGSN